MVGLRAILNKIDEIEDRRRDMRRGIAALEISIRDREPGWAPVSVDLDPPWPRSALSLPCPSSYCR